MSRYIDADALIEAMGEEPYVWTDSDDEIAERNQWLTDMHIIENAPSIDLADYVPKEFHDKTCEAMAKAHQEEIADMVSVVRCKDCKYDHKCNHSVQRITSKPDYMSIIYVPIGWCERGEREGECIECHYEPKDEPMKTADYCDICKRDMCEDCIADATNPYCVPSHYEINYEPKDEPQTDCSWK